VFQAVILWSVLVGCLTAGLLAGLQLRRARAARPGPDDLGGVRELCAAPAPIMPAAGAQTTTEPPMPPSPVLPAPVSVAARSRMNNGGARFGGQVSGRTSARRPAMPTRG
jgi:hypothetical protein